MAQTWRTVRVFISSTFRDMHAEREELVKRIFPQLRKLCEERGVTWGEVDLRWGVTDEQKAEGKVLPICLAEIHRCRPYFIGLLGERYGWMPYEIDAELIEREPWLAEHRQHSVTELEILHGVLNNPEMADHAYFYFRDPTYAKGSPELQESPTEEEIKKYGCQEAERRAEDRRKKLIALKERIRKAKLPVRENYRDPQALGQLVLEDLTEVINRLYPADEEVDPLDREAADHEAFAASRTGVYIGREEYFERLDEHARGDGPPLVVLGESGSGKSALLANWAMRYRDAHPNELLLMHFIGSSRHSTDWAAMLRRIMRELKRNFDIRQDIPDKPDELRATFANWLHMAAGKGRVVLILDALNQLEDRDGAPDLVWLPPEIPANVRLILSTLPGRPLDDLTKRGWPTLHVALLVSEERTRLIAEHLKQYSKTLSPDRVKLIAKAPQTANPLYLRALLEELRLFGKHEELDKQMRYYLSAPTVDRLYEKILERYEQDYERDRPGLVRDAMSLLWAARRGLSEAELLEMLGSEQEPLLGAYWSPLYLAAEQALVSRSGLIGFFHDFLERAIRNRYLSTAEKQVAAHQHLAEYFESLDLGPRKVDELPWQLARSKLWQQLYCLLGDLAFFTAAWESDQFDVKEHWAQVEGNSELQMVDAYRPVIDRPRAHNSSHVWDLANLLTGTGHPTETLVLQKYLAEYFRQIGNRPKLARSVGNQGAILYRRGDWDGAMALYKEQERICRELGNKYWLQVSLGNQGEILHHQGDLDGARALYKQKERICRELGDPEGLARSLVNQALILTGDLNQLHEGLASIEEAYKLATRHGLTALAEGIKPILDRIRSRTDG